MEYSRKSSLKWILTYLIIGIFAYGAIYYFFLNNEGKYVYGPQNEQTQTQTKNSLEATDWKTYANSEYGFEIKYPQDAVFMLNPDQYDTSRKIRVMMSQDFGETGSVTVIIDNKASINDCYADYSSQPISSQSQKLTINGMDFYIAENLDDAMGGQRGIDTNYVVMHNDTCFVIQRIVSWHSVEFEHSATDGLKPTQQELDAQNMAIQKRREFASAIISTFKFIK